MDLILITIFSGILYRHAKQHGVPPGRYLVHLIGSFVLLELLIVYLLRSVYGSGFIFDEDGRRSMLLLQPAALGLITLLFFVLHRQIKREGKALRRDEENTNDPPVPPGKDLSYFR
ncbi:MAG: hypothetical protein NZM35_02945 [Chitinophagales bacterium]|nr:hypothetical protein [Chitinophagales bacterium]MDW8418299.1 hypothetical protein [Chitinophagales bacterium]